jgi:hypothetical protein
MGLILYIQHAALSYNGKYKHHLSFTTLIVFLIKKNNHQEKTALEDVGRYLLTVRAEYLFLVILHYTHMEDHNRVQMEYEDFCRYVYTPQGLL